MLYKKKIEDFTENLLLDAAWAVFNSDFIEIILPCAIVMTEMKLVLRESDVIKEHELSYNVHIFMILCFCCLCFVTTQALLVLKVAVCDIFFLNLLNASVCFPCYGLLLSVFHAKLY